MSTAEKPIGYRNKEKQTYKPLQSSTISTKINRRTLNEIYLRQNRIIDRLKKETDKLSDEVDRLRQNKMR